MIDHIRVYLYLWTPFVASIVFSFLSEINIWLKLLLIFAAFIHARWGMWFLDMFGLVEPLFCLEMLTGYSRAFLLSGNIQKHQAVVPTVLKMDAPDDIEAFKAKLHAHFMTFKRCRSMVKNIGAEFFMKKVTNPGMLQEMVEIHDETLDEESLQQFIAKKLEVYQEVIDGRPMLKIWLIPAASGENGTKEIFIFAKFYHFATDGLSIT